MKVLNPFFTSPIIPDEYFCDREAESKRLVKLLINGNNVVLISPRRMGKTGLVRHIYASEEIAGRYNTFFVDILHTTSLRELAFAISKEVFNTLKPQGKKILDEFLAIFKSLNLSLEYNPESGLPEFSIHLGDIVRPEATIEEIFRYLEKSPGPCILAIDEFQQVRNYADDTNVEALLRSQVQKTTNCRFIYSGSSSRIMSDMFTSSKRPFYNSADIMSLERIDRDVYVSFAAGKFSEFGRRIEPAEVYRIYDMFDGYTYYLQRVMNEVFSNVAESGLAGREIIDNSIDSIIRAYSISYREQLSTLKDKQKQVLVAIAKEDQASGVTSENFIRKYSLPTASSIQNALRKLTEREIVHRDGDSYTVYDKFLALWLKETY